MTHDIASTARTAWPGVAWLGQALFAWPRCSGLFQTNNDAACQAASLRSAPLRSAALRSAPLRFASLHSTSLRFASLQFASLRFASPRFASPLLVLLSRTFKGKHFYCEAQIPTLYVIIRHRVLYFKHLADWRCKPRITADRPVQEGQLAGTV